MTYRFILIASFLSYLTVLVVLSNPAIQALDLNSNPQNLDDLSQGSLTVKRMATMPLAFTENQGQWDDKVSFRANAGGATMWFTAEGVTYQFIRTISRNDEAGSDDRYDPALRRLEGRPREPDSLEHLVIKASFVGANLNPRMAGVQEMEYKCNYFIGNDPSQWHTDVPNYKAVVYEEVYSGIDLKYYGNGKQMEYDFIV